MTVNHEIEAKVVLEAPTAIPVGASKTTFYRNSHNCKLTKKAMLENCLSYLSNQEKTFSCIFRKLWKRIKYFQQTKYNMLCCCVIHPLYKLFLFRFFKNIIKDIDVIWTANLFFIQNENLWKDIKFHFDERYLQ